MLAVLALIVYNPAESLHLPVCNFFCYRLIIFVISKCSYTTSVTFSYLSYLHSPHLLHAVIGKTKQIVELWSGLFPLHKLHLCHYTYSCHPKRARARMGSLLPVDIPLFSRQDLGSLTSACSSSSIGDVSRVFYACAW